MPLGAQHSLTNAMLSRTEVVYGVQFSCFWYITCLLGKNARVSDKFYEVNEVVFACLVMLMTVTLFGFILILYKIYDYVRIHVLNRNNSNVSEEEEMVVLMEALDGEQTAEEDTPSSHIPRPEVDGTRDVAYSVIRRALKERNELLLNLYVVATGIFLSVFALAALDYHSIAFFALGLCVLAIRDAYRRAYTTPICYMLDLTKPIHKCTVLLESGVVLLSITCLALYNFAVPVQEPRSYLPKTYDIIIWLCSFLSPLLVSIAPTDYHCIVVVESSLPICAFLAILILYAMSPIGPQLELMAQTKQLHTFLCITPCIFLATLISLVNMIRRAYALLLVYVFISWITVITSFDYIFREFVPITQDMTSANGTNVLETVGRPKFASTDQVTLAFVITAWFSIATFASLIGYRWKSIVSHSLQGCFKQQILLNADYDKNATKNNTNSGQECMIEEHNS